MAVRDPLGRIGAQQGDLGTALFTEGVEELLQRLLVPTILRRDFEQRVTSQAAVSSKA
jgi:hypothetical protein